MVERPGPPKKKNTTETDDEENGYSSTDDLEGEVARRKKAMKMKKAGSRSDLRGTLDKKKKSTMKRRKSSNTLDSEVSDKSPNSRSLASRRKSSGSASIDEPKQAANKTKIQRPRDSGDGKSTDGDDGSREDSIATGGSGGETRKFGKSKSPTNEEGINVKNKVTGFAKNVGTDGGSWLDEDGKKKGKMNESVNSFDFNDKKWEDAKESEEPGVAPTFADFNETGFNDSVFSPTGFDPQENSAFDAESSGFPQSSSFDPQASAFQSFGSNSAFDTQQPVVADGEKFGSPHRNALDTSPFQNPPRRKTRLQLIKSTVLSKNIVSEPVVNPLTGNIICCFSRNNIFYIEEVDPRRENVPVHCSRLLTPEIQDKVTKKYGRAVYGIDNVLNVCVGIVRSHGQPRVHVVTAIDLSVLDSKNILRTIAVWNWGSGLNKPLGIQFLLSPPSGSDYSYDHNNIQVADGIIFVAGASANKGPCVFMCKPTIKESWAPNFLSSAGKITYMCVTPDHKRDFPYLAIGLSDGNLSIWTYAAAMRQAPLKKNEASRRLLYPLCRLGAFWVLTNIEPTSFTDDKKKPRDSREIGSCTHLSWMPPKINPSSLLLLSASFQGGLAVFHVSLPVVSDRAKKGRFVPVPAPTQSTQLNDTPQIWPFAAIRWQSLQDRASCSWLDYGPHNNPCIALLLHGKNTDEEPGKVVMGTINYNQYRKGIKPKERLCAFRMLATVSWRSKTKNFPLCLVGCQAIRGIVCQMSHGILRLSPSLTSVANDPVAKTLHHPIFSNAFGLCSNGDTFTDGAEDSEGVLHVFTSVQCDRVKNDSEAGVLDWSRPSRRHWVCRTICGDSKEAQNLEETKEDKGSSPFGDDDEITRGGSVTDVVCELDADGLAGLTPFRIVRCPGKSIFAILFRPALGSPVQGNSFGVSLDAVAMAMVDTGVGKSVLDVIEGRDIAFLPTVEDDPLRAVVLSVDGGAASIHTYQSNKWRKGTSCRPILGTDMAQGYVESQRLFIIPSGSKYGVVVVGKKVDSERACILAGPFGTSEEVSGDGWINMLPEMPAVGPTLLNDGEELYSLISLPHDQTASGNISLATSSRVMILTTNLQILAEQDLDLASPSLAPLGSSTVGFFTTDAKFRYLCCLDSKFATGVIATLPLPKGGLLEDLLLATRPDRFLHLELHSGKNLVERRKDPDSFLLPTAITRPAILLEPMVANAVFEGSLSGVTTSLLKRVVEKFGRKVKELSHQNTEGIGNVGSGMTPRLFDILSHYGLKNAASWLLTGIVRFDRTANSKVLPPWIPIPSKKHGAPNADAFLHLVSNGDQYLSDYLKSPDHNAPSSLPRPSDPTPYLCNEYGLNALEMGNALDAMKMLDIVGTESSESMLFQLSLLMELKAGDTVDILKSLSGYDEYARSSSGLVNSNSSLSALAVSLKLNGATPGMSEEHIKRWMKPLAPSLRRGTRFGRVRQRLVGEEALGKVGGPVQPSSLDKLWVQPCNENRHVWNEGPHKEKENLLLLDKLEDWLGRRHPILLGKDGAAEAAGRGESTLANILDFDNDNESAGEDIHEEIVQEGWAEGVGEGRKDEDNLSAYFRFHEGEEDEGQWREEGLTDASQFQNVAVLMGQKEAFSLQPSSSSVDEGEPGKVRILHDLVFNEAGVNKASGFVISARRGSSLDVGMLHSLDRDTRQRCTVEFWYRPPPLDMVSGEIILARRTVGPSADDLSKICLASERSSMLWEVALMKSGELEFRTCSGQTTRSAQQGSSDGESSNNHLAVFDRWNHLCLIFSSKNMESPSDCEVVMMMKGKSVLSRKVSMLPSGTKAAQLKSTPYLDDLMQKSHLVFGINNPATFRLTELRVWACSREEDDIRYFMTEYLTAAEKRKKFTVKIKNQKKQGGLDGAKGGLGLAPPKGGLAPPKGSLAPPKGGLAPPKGGLAPPKGASKGILAPPKSGLSPPKGTLAPPKSGLLAPPKGASSKPIGRRNSGGTADTSEDLFSSTLGDGSDFTKTEDTSFEPTSFGATFGSFADSDVGAFDSSTGFGSPMPTKQSSQESFSVTAASSTADTGGWGDFNDISSPPASSEPKSKSSLWDEATPLSQQVRASAATALIRGPPATRHFGGNRGGLPDLKGTHRHGVGGIAVCGSEKTIVWRDEENPPAVTYPIGASGAIVSDRLDDEEGSEFICCFLAKDKRMVVFELNSKTVVVELQMTTKLNFWRFLPPEAGESTLCFMLITPVGGFHWMPLDDSPRPRQVWKRGSDLQGKKVVSYEEGGTNGLSGPQIFSKVGLITVSNTTANGSLEAWVVPVCGDSVAVLASDNIMGAALWRPLNVGEGRFCPNLALVEKAGETVTLSVISIQDRTDTSVGVGEKLVSVTLPLDDIKDSNFEAPVLAMGHYPEVLSSTLGNLIVVIFRSQGVMFGYETKEDNTLHLIAQENLGHYVVDAVMRYSGNGGPEVIMLLTEKGNHKDGRIVSFHFQTM